MPILDWIGKESVSKHAKEITYNLLEVNSEMSINIENSNDNTLIHGDNLIALKSLMPKYFNTIKFAYLDVPYNTGNENWIYNDNVNDPQISLWLGKVVGKEFEDLSRHDKWLCMMYPRLQIVRDLISDDGFVCVQIDDNESHNLKLIMDELFLPSNYVTTIYVQVRYLDKTLKRDMDFHKQIEQILVYRKTNKAKPILPKVDYGYDKFNYKIVELENGKEIELGNKKVQIFQPNQYKIVKEKSGFKEGLKEIWASGSILDGNSSGRFFRDYLTGRKDIDGLGVLYKVHDIGDDMYDYRYFTGPKKANATKGKYYQGVPMSKMEDNSTDTVPITNFYDMAANFGNCRHEGGVEFNSGKKPELLISKLLEYFTNEGDLIIDSFAGSGTTAAVAHKMKRKWITIEMGDHCFTHTYERLKNVVLGNDKTGVSEKYSYQGYGGFNFYEVGPCVFDRKGFLNRDIEDEKLAELLFYLETKTSIKVHKIKYPFLGQANDKNIFLLPKDISDLRVFTQDYLNIIDGYKGRKVVYADILKISETMLKEFDIEFKQIPYDIGGK